MEEQICVKCEKKKFLIEFVVLQYGVVLDTCKLCYKPDLDKERKAIHKELKRRLRAKNKIKQNVSYKEKVISAIK